MGRLGFKTLLAGASITAVGASSLVVGGAPVVGAQTVSPSADVTTTVTIDMTCLPDPLTKQEYGNTAISGGLAEGLFTAGPDAIRWTADDEPTSPMAMPLSMDVTHADVATPGADNPVTVFLQQDFGQTATDTLNNQVIPQMGPNPLTLRSFWMVFGSSYPRLGIHLEPPTGTTFDLPSLSLLQSPDASDAISHGVPPLLTTGLTDASGGAEANSSTSLQVELGDEEDTPIAATFYQAKGDRGGTTTGFVVEPQWTDPGVASPPAPSVVAPNAVWNRVQNDAFSVTSTIDVTVPIGLAGTTIDLLPAAAPVDFNLGLWIAATLDGQTTTTSGRVNFDWECTADNPTTPLLSIPVASLGSTVSGTVLEDGSGNPLAGISVRLNDKATNAQVQKVATDASGNYSFTGVADGEYIIRFVDLDGLHTPEFSNEAATRFTAATVTVAAGDVVVDESLAPDGQGSIQGIVTEDGSGTPLAGVSVRLLANDGVTLLGVRTTKADGSYLFGNQPFGSYKVRFIDADASHVGEFNVNAPTRHTATTVTHNMWISQVDAGLAIT